MATHYVRKTGDDANGGTSKDDAWKTLSHAMDQVNDGDTLISGGGDFTDEDLADGIVVRNNLTIQGDYTGVLTGDSGWTKVRTIVLTGKSIVLQWLWVIGTGIIGIQVGDNTVVGVATNELEHIVMEGAQDTLVLGDNTSITSTAILDTCWFNGRVNCYQNGEVYVRSCTFTNDGTTEHYFGGAAGSGYIIRIKNCIFKSSTETSNALMYFGIADPAGGTSAFDIDYNDYYTSGKRPLVHTAFGEYWYTIEEWQTSRPADWGDQNQNSMEKDPLFKADGFHIKEDSPCIDVGTSYGLSRDIDNETRPRGEGYDIGCDEYYYPETSIDTFTFEVSPRARAGPVLIRNTPYREPQLKWTCTHNLPSGQYTLYTCPRCLGQGYYYDIKFDAGGLIPQVWDETKLAQELEKITITDFNPFHPEYGAKLKSRAGQVSKDELKAIIRTDLLNAIYNLVKYQKAEANKGTEDGYFSPRELIDSVKKIEIAELSVTELSFVIYVLTVSGKEVEITGKILV